MPDRTVKTVLSAQVSGFVANYKTAQKAATQFSDKVGDGAIKNKQHLDTLSGSLATVGVGAVAMAGLAIKSFADFDKQMSAVKAATHETAGNMDLLRAAAVKAGADTAFSATEAADGIEQMAKAGVSTKDILSGGLTGTLALAAAGEVSVGDAAEYAATALTQFHLQGSQIPHVADLMAAAAGKAQGEVTDMATALKYVGPIAGQMGVSIEEAAGTIALLASNGIIGDQAGTSLRGMLSSLTSPSVKAADQMKALGINVYNAAGNFVGFNGVAEQLHDKLGNLSNAERDAALGVIFGNEQLTAARVLYQGGAEAVDDWTRKVNDGGYAVETAALKMDNLAGDFEKLKGSLSTVFIESSSGANAGLRTLTQMAEDAVNAFSGLPDSIQGATIAIVGSGGLVLLGTAGLLKLVTGVAEVKTALETLNVTALRTATLLKFATIAGGAVVITGFLDRLSDRIQGTTVDVDKLSASLKKWADSGHATGAAAKLIGDNAQWLGDAFARLASPNLAFRISNLGDTLLPFSGPLDDSKRRVEELDKSLMALTKGGGGDQAAKVFADIAAKAKEQGVSVAELNALFPRYAATVKQAADKTGELTTKQEDNAGAAIVQEEKISDAAQALKDMDTNAQDVIDSLKVLNGTMNDLEAQSAYEGAVDAVTDRLKDYREEQKKGEAGTKHMKNALDLTSQAGRDNFDVLDSLWTKASDYAAQISRTAGGQGRANEILKAGRTQLVGMATEFFGSKAAAEKYVTEVLHIPKNVSTTYKAPGLPDASAKADHYQATAHNLNGFVATTTFRTVHEEITHYLGATSSGIPKSLLKKQPAAGGRVSSYQPLAGGGMAAGPGGPRDDAAGLFALSNGEFVVNAAATRANLPLLQAINAGSPRPVMTGPSAGWSAAAQGGQGGAFEGNLYLDSGQLLGLVRGEIRENSRGIRRRVTAGAGGAA